MAGGLHRAGDDLHGKFVASRRHFRADRRCSDLRHSVLGAPPRWRARARYPNRARRIGPSHPRGEGPGGRMFAGRPLSPVSDEIA